MVTYKATDIISAAMQEADLENTSFITAAENKRVLNNAFIQVFELAINSDATFWINEAEITEGENNLPDDFYQLRSIKDKDENDIPRKNKDSRKSERWYDIRNGKLILNRVSAADIEYYPEPQTLYDDTITDGESTDMTLSFPSNLFYPLLIHKLAKYYKVKQGGDVSGITVLEEEAEQTFYNTLNRDNNEFIQMRDVYRNRRW